MRTDIITMNKSLRKDFYQGNSFYFQYLNSQVNLARSARVSYCDQLQAVFCRSSIRTRILLPVQKDNTEQRTLFRNYAIVSLVETVVM